MMTCEIILGALVTLLFVLAVRYWVGYICKSDTSCKIKFSDFLKWYSVNPKAWEIDTEDNYVYKKLDTFHHITCRFGYIDFIRLNEAESVTRRVMENPHPESPVEDFLKVWRNIKIH